MRLTHDWLCKNQLADSEPAPWPGVGCNQEFLQTLGIKPDQNAGTLRNLPGQLLPLGAGIVPHIGCALLVKPPHACRLRTGG